MTVISIDESRKHRQWYRHADPRRQQMHTAVAARVTSDRDGFLNHVTLTFDLLTSVNACRSTAIEYMCIKFGADISCRFLFIAWTNRQTDAIECCNHASSCTTGVVNEIYSNE